jgi:hypothetical protein
MTEHGDDLPPRRRRSTDRDDGVSSDHTRLNDGGYTHDRQGAGADTNSPEYNDATISEENRRDLRVLHNFSIRWEVCLRRWNRIRRWLQSTITTILAGAALSWLVTGVVPPGIKQMVASVIAYIHERTGP